MMFFYVIEDNFELNEFCWIIYLCVEDVVWEFGCEICGCVEFCDLYFFVKRYNVRRMF